MTGEVEVTRPQPPALAEGSDPLLVMIARAAADPATDVDKFERLMAMYDRHLEREAHRAYTAAMAVMQPLLPEIEERGNIYDKAGEVQSTYALWEDTQAAIKPILAQHGFSLNFEIARGEGQIAVTGILSHAGGHEQRTTMTLPLDTSGNKNAVQAHGSTVAYGKRYTAGALLNLTSRGEDDDGVTGGTKFVSEGELEALRLLIARGKFDEEKFCANVLKVPALDQLPARRYRFAELRLTEALAKRALQAKPRPPAEPAEKAKDATSTAGSPGRSDTGERDD